MSMTYAGIDLPLWTPEAAVWAEANIRPSDIYEFDVHHTRHFFTHLPLAAPPYLPPVRVGELQWPIGASRWGVFYAIVSCARMDQIRAACVSGNGKYWTPQTLTLDDGHMRPVTAQSMTMLPPRPLSGIPGQFYLLPLVDKRYFWWRMPWNIQAADLVSWTQFFTSFGVSLSTPIDPAYTTPDTTRWMSSTQEKPVPLLMDAAANSVLRKIILKLDGTVWAKTWDESRQTNCDQFDPLVVDQRQVRAGGRMFSGDICRSAPAKIDIVFPPASGNGNPTVVTKSLGNDITNSGNSAYGCYGNFNGYACNPVGGWYGQAGWDTCTGAYGSYGCYGCYGFFGTEGTRGAWLSDYTGGDATIQAGLASRAVVDYYGWFLADADIVWHGMIPAEPNGYVDRISWNYTSVESSTRYQAPPAPNGSHLGGWSPSGGTTVKRVVLVGVRFQGGENVEYKWRGLLDDETSPLTYTTTSEVAWATFHAKDHYLPVAKALDGAGNTISPKSGYQKSVVTISPGSTNDGSYGNYGYGYGQPSWIIDETHPWEDLFRRTGVSDLYGEVAYLRYWDQNLAAWADGMEVRLVPAG